jgi:fatty-acyl-CoA synthase
MKRGDRIGIWGPNSYEWLLTQWAAARSGLILVNYSLFLFQIMQSNFLVCIIFQVNINPAYQAGELRYALEKVGVKTLVVAKKFRNTNLVDTLSQLVPQLDPNQTPNHLENTNKLLVSSNLTPSLERVIVMSDEPQFK